MADMLASLRQVHKATSEFHSGLFQAIAEVELAPSATGAGM